MSSNARRFGDVVQSRREQLDLTQIDVWQAGGPSNTTLTAIENGKQENLSRATARKLDKGLRWVEGSAKTVWLGGDPTPLAHSIPQDVLEEIQHLSPKAREYVLRVLGADREQPERGDAS